MSIQLRKFHVKNLSLSTSIPTTAEVSQAVWKALGVDPTEGHFYAQEVSGEEGSTFEINFFLFNRRSPEGLFLLIGSSRVTGGRQPVRRNIDELWKALAAIQEEQKVVGEVTLAYPSSEYSSVFDFPLRVPPSPLGIFDEIRGMRVVKLNEGKKVYDVLVEQPESEEVSSTVKFSYIGRLDPDLPAAVLEAAHAISSKFIVRREKES